MRQRILGQSGISASVIGFGAWALGGWMWGGTDESESIRAIHAAIDAGVNLIDTAAIYGFGLSETIVGKAIEDRRDKVVLATKCGMVCNTRKGVFRFKSKKQPAVLLQFCRGSGCDACWNIYNRSFRCLCSRAFGTGTTEMVYTGTLAAKLSCLVS